MRAMTTPYHPVHRIVHATHGPPRYIPLVPTDGGGTDRRLPRTGSRPPRAMAATPDRFGTAAPLGAAEPGD
ncbi:hypothetical protein GCM10017687_27700 [Streptomyces echinatus]